MVLGNPPNPHFFLVFAQRPFFIFLTNSSTSFWVALDLRDISLKAKKLAIYLQIF